MIRAEQLVDCLLAAGLAASNIWLERAFWAPVHAPPARRAAKDDSKENDSVTFGCNMIRTSSRGVGRIGPFRASPLEGVHNKLRLWWIRSAANRLRWENDRLVSKR
jgi:hypothetical protein